ncbi:hypothetical protein SAMN05216376_1257 [Mameliella alba]|uniref:hypothetical protein n=1 Tax=Mameliella alba TaxID=561184 RepID=UPI0008855CED|nr:hypothetical protein [Mameliella alba]PTR33739.1 hypothetical protein LX94_05035 [Mameliella alba]GGF85190.1 hypothetical protein GCM10011319_51390 [Mameliella alba]SDE30065.1 hypothetical protein SAMN05216376_1257 [Mameliella alba]
MTHLISHLPLAFAATLACGLAALAPAHAEPAMLAANCAGLNFADVLCEAVRF